MPQDSNIHLNAFTSAVSALAHSALVLLQPSQAGVLVYFYFRIQRFDMNMEFVRLFLSHSLASFHILPVMRGIVPVREALRQLSPSVLLYVWTPLVLVVEVGGSLGGRLTVVPGPPSLTIDGRVLVITPRLAVLGPGLSVAVSQTVGSVRFLLFEEVHYF